MRFAARGSLLRALHYRNYRLFFFGQGLSLIGTWTQYVAIGWLIYRLTGSTLLLGAVAFFNQIPTLLFAPFAGVMADRWDRRNLLLWTQALSMLQALILAWLVLSRQVETWHIMALSLFIGTVNAFDIPIRQSFVIQMVDRKEDLGNAIALNSAMFNSARFIGPSIAGVLISTLGEGVCFLLNGLSYVAVIAALLAIRVAPRQLPGKKGPIWGEFREGMQYAYEFKPILGVLLLLSVFSIAGSPYLVLMPAFAKDVLHGEAHTFGFLMSAAGIGAVSATLVLASLRRVHGFISLIPAAVAVFSVALAAFALTRTFALSLVFLYAAGVGMMLQIACSNTLLQTVVDEDKRGRVMSLFAMSFMGVMPFGNLLAGSIAGVIGVPNTLLLGAACCLAGAGIFVSRLRELKAMLQPVLARLDACPTADGKECPAPTSSASPP
ncbi:MAG: MFS transporter [Desulfobacteraceae bacterium]|nr:MFS transporter [Desulfobacteraceae bacterium]